MKGSPSEAFYKRKNGCFSLVHESHVPGFYISAIVEE